MLGIPSIIFSEAVEYEDLSFIKKCSNLTKLSSLIRSHFFNIKLDKTKIVDETKRYLLAIEKLSFSAPKSHVYGNRSASVEFDKERVLKLLNECIDFQKEKSHV